MAGICGPLEWLYYCICVGTDGVLPWLRHPPYVMEVHGFPLPPLLLQVTQGARSSETRLLYNKQTSALEAETMQVSMLV